MRVVWQLSWAFLKEYRLRVLLTSIATIAASCAVVWVVSGYDALLGSFEDFSDKSLGRYSLSVAPISTYRQYAPGDIPAHAEKFVPPGVVDDLRADPQVRHADPMWAKRAIVSPTKGGRGGRKPSTSPDGAPSAGDARPDSGGRTRGGGDRPSKEPSSREGAGGDPAGTSDVPGMGDARELPGEHGTAPGARQRTPDARVLGTDSPEPPFPLLRGRWLGALDDAQLEAAASADAAKRLSIDVGDDLIVGGVGHETKVRIIGIVDAPVVADVHGNIAAGQLASPSVGGLYVRMPIAERIHGTARRISFVGVSLRDGVDVTKFRFGWSPRLSRFETPVQFQEAHDIEEALDVSASADNIKMQAYGATGMSLLAALFIIFSTLSMGVGERTRQFAILRAIALTRAQIAQLVAVEGLVLGTIGFLGGIGAGRLLLYAYERDLPNARGESSVMGANTILLAAACAYGGALLASLIPAWRATRVRPVDAMAPRPDVRDRRVSLIGVVVGLLLIAVNPILTFALPFREGARYALYLVVGCTSMAIGFILLAPAAVAFVDRFVSPLLARLVGLEPKLVASQTSMNLWRTVGTAVGLMVGLGLYVAIQVWGFTMLEPFVPGKWAPDALIAFKPGIDPAAAAGVASISGVDPDRALPIVVEQPRLVEDLTHSAERASVTRQDSIVIIGVDVRRGLGGPKPLLAFDWVRGSLESALPRLETGRGCVVPEHFLRESGLDVGDAFSVVPPEDSEHPVSYTIAGSVDLPGWHWQTKPTGMRTRTHRAAALVFASYAVVASDFGLTAASHVWLDFDPAKTDVERLGKAAQSLYAGVLARPVAIGGGPPGGPSVRVMPIEGVRKIIRAHAEQWIEATSRLPLITLLITGIGLLNTILASVRARRWDMGVLRAIGFTRSTLVRLVMVEGLLVGIVACVLSLGFGVVAGWCGTGMSQHTNFFGGLDPALVVPWVKILFGLGVALCLSAVVATWPAASIGRAKPLALLQQGRVSM